MNDERNLTTTNESVIAIEELANQCMEWSEEISKQSSESIAQSMNDTILFIKDQLQTLHHEIQIIKSDETKIKQLVMHIQENKQHMNHSIQDIRQEELETALIIQQEKDIRQLLTIAETSCLVLNRACDTITKNDLNTIAQLSQQFISMTLKGLSSLLYTIGKEERAKVYERITIEEILSPEEEEERRMENKKKKYKAIIKPFIFSTIDQVRLNARIYPISTSIVTITILPMLPFMFLPVVTVTGFSLFMENQFPAQTHAIYKAGYNSMQLMKLSFFFTKMSLRPMYLISIDTAGQVYEYTKTHGVLTTAQEAMKISWQIASLTSGYLYEALFSSTTSTNDTMKKYKME